LEENPILYEELYYDADLKDLILLCFKKDPQERIKLE